MAIVIQLAEKRILSARHKPSPGSTAQILLFTGVRFERLEVSGHVAADVDQRPADETLRNRTG